MSGEQPTYIQKNRARRSLSHVPFMQQEQCYTYTVHKTREKMCIFHPTCFSVTVQYFGNFQSQSNSPF
jgi:hypothetical protein